MKTDRKQHPIAQSQPGTALLYFFGDEDVDNYGIHVGSAAISLAAEPGQVYYFQRLTPHLKRPEDVVLEPVDPAAAHLLIANSALATSHPK